MTARPSLPGAVRLHKPAEYAAALKGRRIARGQWLSVHVAYPTPAADPAAQPPAPSVPHARLGLVIAKRMAKRAVTRNAIKRVLREAFRHLRHILPPHSFVFRLVNPVAPTSLTVLKKQMRTEADALFHQARKRLATSE